MHLYFFIYFILKYSKTKKIKPLPCHPPGILHLLVSGRIQLRHPQEDRRSKPQHRWSRLHGPPLCGQGVGAHCQQGDHGLCYWQRRTSIWVGRHLNFPDTVVFLLMLNQAPLFEEGSLSLGVVRMVQLTEISLFFIEL